MNKLLKEAIDKVSGLPEADQEMIGSGLLLHVKKLRRLRSEIDKGIRSLDAKEGREMDIEDFIQKAQARHRRS